MKTKCRRIMSIFVASLLVLTSVCTGFSVSAAGEEKVTYEYFVDCDDEINAFEGEVAFPDGLSVYSIKIHDSIQEESEPFYTVKNNKIVFLATIVGNDETVDYFNFSDGKALISVDFIVNGEYDKKDITTTLTEFYSTKVIYEGNIPFEYENQVNNEVISSGHVDLDNPSDSHANPIVTFVDGDNVTTEIVEYNTAVSKPTDPTKDGYDFLGWYLGNSEYNFSNPVTEDITLEAKWEVQNTLLKANTVSFADNLTLNFLATLKDKDVDNAYVVFTYNHYGENKEVIVNASKNDMYNNMYYRFRCELTASEMCIVVNAKLYINGTLIDEYNRSIRDYCISGMQRSTREVERKLFRTTLNYGGYTQKHFNYNGEPYAYEDYKDSMDDVTVTSEVEFNRPSGFSQGISYHGSSVFFVYAPYVRYYFKLDGSYNIDNYTFLINNKEVSAARYEETNYYYIEAESAFAYELDKAEQVIVKKGNTEVFNFNYSVIKWAEVASGKATDEDEINMIKSLFSYYNAAKAFVNSNQ